MIEKERIKSVDQINKLQNEQYEIYLKIESLKQYINDLSEDHEYASKLYEIIRCPYCGTRHENSAFNKSEIIKDIQSAKDMISFYRDELKSINVQTEHSYKYFAQVNKSYNTLRIRLEKVQEQACVIETLKTEGKKDLLTHIEHERNSIEYFSFKTYTLP